MSKIICDKNEHYIDPSQSGGCPFCAEDMQPGSSSAGERTEFVGDPFKDPAGGTKPYNGTVKLDESLFNNFDDPTKVTPASKNVTKILRPSGDTFESNDVLPVAGWIVIISGEGIGRDFRLVQGENKIGRNAEMEVCLDFGDETVSRDTHAVIVHDSRNASFFIERGSSRNLPLLNGQTVRRDEDLNSGDEIQVGETILVFVPFVSI
jgi:hypothetical protein